jgi:hypothetical protein
VEWFAFDQIPNPLSTGHKKRIEDAIAGVSGTVVLQEISVPTFPEKLTRKELIELRDQSGLSRQEFYLQMIELAELKEKIELTGK